MDLPIPRTIIYNISARLRVPFIGMLPIDFHSSDDDEHIYRLSGTKITSRSPLSRRRNLLRVVRSHMKPSLYFTARKKYRHALYTRVFLSFVERKFTDC